MGLNTCIYSGSLNQPTYPLSLSHLDSVLLFIACSKTYHWQTPADNTLAYCIDALRWSRDTLSAYGHLFPWHLVCNTSKGLLLHWPYLLGKLWRIHQSTEWRHRRWEGHHSQWWGNIPDINATCIGSSLGTVCVHGKTWGARTCMQTVKTGLVPGMSK